jgi:hypothetical protein
MDSVAKARTVVWFVVVFCFAAVDGSAQNAKFTTQAIAGYQTVRGTTTKVDELTQLNQTLTDPSQPFGDFSVDSPACLGCSGIDGDGIHLVTTAGGLVSQVMATVALADFAFQGHSFTADWLMNNATASCPATPGGTATVSAAPSVNWVTVDNTVLLSPPNPVTDPMCWDLDTLQRLPSSVPVPNSICVNQILDRSTSASAASISSAAFVVTSRTGDQAVVAVAHAEVAECGAPNQAAPKKFCISVLGEVKPAKPTFPSPGSGKVEIIIKKDANSPPKSALVDLAHIEVDGRERQGIEPPTVHLADSALTVAKKLRDEAKSILNNTNVGPIRGNSFCVQAQEVRIVKMEDPKLKLFASEGQCPAVKEWKTEKRVTIKEDPRLVFTETEKIDNGDLASCITIFNLSDKDLTLGPQGNNAIFLMLNWADDDGNVVKSPHYPDETVFPLITKITVPFKGSQAQINNPVPRATIASVMIDTNNSEGSVKVCWKVKKADFSKICSDADNRRTDCKFDLSRKYLAYIDFLNLPTAPTTDSMSNWVKPQRIQGDGTVVGYNWYPTNPVFSTTARSLRFEVDTAESVLPDGWEVTTISPGSDQTIRLDVEEMQAGFFLLQLPSASPPGTLGRVVINGVDPETGQFLMVDSTEIVSAPQDTDFTPPLCTLTAMAPGPLGSAQIVVRDFEAGLTAISLLTAINVVPDIPAFPAGTTEPVVVIATPIRQGEPASIALQATDKAGNVTTCEQGLARGTDVTADVRIVQEGFRFQRATGYFVQAVKLENRSHRSIPGPVSLVLDNLSDNASLVNIEDGLTVVAPHLNSAFINVNSSDSELNPGERVEVVLFFSDPSKTKITYDTRVVAGPGAR